MSEKMREALLKCKTCALPTEVRDLVIAALAEQPAQGDAVAFLANGTRFKLAALPHSAAFMSFPSELAGKWVALVDATDDRHLLLKAPPAPSVPDGWKLVPERLPEAMERVGEATLDRDGALKEMWANMLAAAPEPRS